MSYIERAVTEVVNDLKLLFVFTGGTIGSTVSGEYISTDENKPYKLIEAYNNKYGLDHAYDVMTPYTDLSEQNTGETISKLVECIYDVQNENDLPVEPEDNSDNNIETKHRKYDGIIVTHGTDTLPYSAAALSYALGNACIPVCIVSSNYPIEDERANGVDNLHGAIRLIEAAYEWECGNRIDSVSNNTDLNKKEYQREDISGVFVSYRNHDGVTYIHRASRLLETSAFSDEYFSVRNEYYGKMAGDAFVKNVDYVEGNDELEPLGAVRLSAVCDDIARYHLYPGIRLCREKASYILLESFHSGTMNTKLEDYQKFFEKMHEEGVPVYLTGIRRGISYESTSLYEKLNIKPIYDIAPVAAYMKLWMLYAAGRECDEGVLNTPLGGDFS